MKNNIIDFRVISNDSGQDSAAEAALHHVLKKTKKTLSNKQFKRACTLTTEHFKNEEELDQQLLRNFFFNFFSERMGEAENLVSLNETELELLAIFSNTKDKKTILPRKTLIGGMIVIAILTAVVNLTNTPQQMITKTTQVLSQESLSKDQINQLKKHVDEIILLQAKHNNKLVSRHSVWKNLKEHISKTTNTGKIRSYKNIPSEHFAIAKAFLVNWKNDVQKNAKPK